VMRALIVAAGLLALPFPAGAASGLADLELAEVVGMIDVTSFPNSIESRRDEGLTTFADYGFTDIELVDRTVNLYEDDRSWMFGITVLGASDDQLVLCVLDTALGGPTYHTQDAMAFQAGDGDLLVATDGKIEDPACPHIAE
jgi:hypothetical protein